MKFIITLNVSDNAFDDPLEQRRMEDCLKWIADSLCIDKALGGLPIDIRQFHSMLTDSDIGVDGTIRITSDDGGKVELKYS